MKQNKLGFEALGTDGLWHSTPVTGTTSRRREFCQFDGTPFFIPIETPDKVRGGGRGGTGRGGRMTVSPAARQNRRLRHRRPRSGR